MRLKLIKIDEIEKLIKEQAKTEINDLKLQVLKEMFKQNKFSILKYILASNIQMHDLLNEGFNTVYNEFYSHATTETILLNIKSQCNQESIICVGGADSYNKLLLVSCGSCLDILTTTVINQPRLVNGAWWYFTPGISFGFAPDSNIVQEPYCDKYDPSNTKRLSWELEGTCGRLGSLNTVANTIPSTYRKIIMLKR